MNDTDTVQPETPQSKRRGRPRPEYSVMQDRAVASALADGFAYTSDDIASAVELSTKQVNASLQRLRRGDGSMKEPLNSRVQLVRRKTWQATSYALTHDPNFGGNGTPREPEKVFHGRILDLPSRTVSEEQISDDIADETSAETEMPVFTDGQQTTATWQPA